VAGDEPVTSPDQHRPTVSRRLARLGAVVTFLALLAMTIGNHQGNVENVFLIGLAALILIVLIADVVMRRNGLKSD
jgi:peptidoglycan/LPS O-acetylase OafA/YrhL